MMKELFVLQADICKTMANPIRMEIIYALKEGEKGVGELVEITGLTKSNVSQHLSVLKSATMVLARRDGKNIFYSIANKKILEACRLMREVLIEHLNDNQKLIDKLQNTK
ncbi:MAG: helix-turn-helix transcriptional regulator [Proteobacteria bacterium]|nr:helix-turn-helix transcriptional regulator [Pseudomonadota bacterium]